MPSPAQHQPSLHEKSSCKRLADERTSRNTRNSVESTKYPILSRECPDSSHRICAQPRCTKPISHNCTNHKPQPQVHYANWPDSDQATSGLLPVPTQWTPSLNSKNSKNSKTSTVLAFHIFALQGEKDTSGVLVAVIIEPPSLLLV
jgi:hypothetical protein